MEHVAKEMPVIEPVAQMLVYLFGQFFKPRLVIPTQGNIQCKDILYRAGRYCGLAGRGACCGEPVQQRLFALCFGAFAIGTFLCKHPL